jgi:hypothetical protein
MTSPQPLSKGEGLCENLILYEQQLNYNQTKTLPLLGELGGSNV